MLDNTQSIICAFCLAACTSRSPHRHLELCGIALNLSLTRFAGPLTRPGPSVATRHLPTLWGVTLAEGAFRLFRLFWPFWQFYAVAHFRRFAVAIIRALSTAGAAHPAVRFTARLSARAAGTAAHTSGGGAGLGCGGHAADAVTLAAAYIGRGVEQIPRPAYGRAAVDGLPCCVHQRKAVAFGTGAAASS